MRSVADLFTFYRIAAAPVIAAMALAGQRDAFFILLIVSYFTDLVDGPIARWLGKASRSGARLDTIADASTTLAALLGVFLFERRFLEPDAAWLYAFFASYAAAAAACLLRFRRLPAYHLFSAKAAAFLAAVFVIWLYLFGFSRPFLLTVVSLGVLANLESVLTTIRLSRFRSDLGSVVLLRDEDGDDES
ncbi:MAG: CDP-alcohol phosphatidyltransferase family protein [Erythrobacter sp.]|uniref:CDP-alcohol phosphatidyltransferase family protein n=1 Tax=Erythrobacter sp. TaxID=1042 RepID=UPI00261B6B43|nr:CDP-alcohol phosphatidyltransferase family protein [Erythrobacter sp.]MDJ0979890.1 CDP-alcohol phosphatidyltransferase family protein [Erythrobacter sp.]